MTTEMFDYSKALELLKAGKLVCRSGWNGKNMFVYLKKGRTPVHSASHIGGVRSELFSIDESEFVTFMPRLCLRAADKSIVVGWLASQTDQLADDWQEYLNGQQP